jgi:hypothetical protein
MTSCASSCTTRRTSSKARHRSSSRRRSTSRTARRSRSTRPIRWAQLIRPMATTHSVDTEQRLVDLPIAERTFCRLRVRVPREPNIAPPGWYMLFITDRNGVPSRATWAHLPPARPRREAEVKPPRGAQRHFAARRLPVKTKGLRIRREPEE